MSTFFKYLSMSTIALCFDYLTYFFLLQYFYMNSPIAAVIGYAMGLLVAYGLISKKVFVNGWLRNKSGFEVGLFILSGMLGMGSTYLVISMSLYVFQSGPYIAKLLAVTVSFLVVYCFRKWVVFRVPFSKVHRDY